MLKKISPLFLLSIIIFSMYSCSSTKHINLTVEEKPLPIAKQTSIVSPPVKVEKIYSVGPVSYRAKIFIYNDTLFIGSTNKHIYMINLRTHDIKSFDIKEPIEAEIYADNYIYVGTTKGQLLKMDYKGGIIWKKQFSFPIVGSIIEDEGYLYVTTTNNTLYKIDKLDGKIMWEFHRNTAPMSVKGFSVPVITNDAIYIGFDNGMLYKLTKNGDEIWEVKVGKGELFVDVDSKAELTSSHVYATSTTGYTQSVSIDKGINVWSKEISSFANLQISPFALFVANEKGGVDALDPQSGNIIWSKTLSYNYDVYSMYLSGNDYLFCLLSNGRLVILNALNGKVMQIFNLGGIFDSKFTYYKNALYIISRNGSIYKIY
ncbi:outer membrane protein assembly factor BamB [Desulfurella multipotens]|uniref:Outer membrane protein assembly factor BamB n=1 Tax=Desulfurella multipotens TaxID=79269 RepID=A0A1G6RLH0_9BACT|nr:PQQ-binding-like beta-propeller repeat protein [Desulfurella multipotens]SDD05520.1 outer membrane protein assembly factor BamB [Desulfurella multipotens]